MQYIYQSSYEPPDNLIYKNAHISTIIPGILKKYPIPPYIRERLELSDGDFLLLDWWKQSNTDKLIIISHGLEGHSRRTYVNSCANYFHNDGYSILAWNQRSCGGEINRLPKLYHMGLIEDLNEVIKHAIDHGYKEINLIGYSMGGILSLNFLGRMHTPSCIKACITFSTPLDLLSNAAVFRKRSNIIYLKNFMVDFKRKLKIKQSQFPEIFDEKKLRDIKSFDELDDFFTAPLFGFKNKEDYYKKNSPLFILNQITIPTLIVNAENDPFLTPESFLNNFEIPNHNLYFEKPKFGGHVGFSLKDTSYSWAEIRAKQFIESIS